ncbi:MAG: C39 family peptidase [Candidatus Sericytochromatia bacterium]
MNLKVNNSNVSPINYDIKANLAQTVKESFQGNSLKDDKKLFNKIDSLPISTQDKNKLKELVSEIKKDSNSGFFKSVTVGSSELAKIQAIANSNPMAKELLSIIEPNLKISSSANKQHSSEANKLSFGNKHNAELKNLPGYTNTPPQYSAPHNDSRGRSISSYYNAAYLDKNAVISNKLSTIQNWYDSQNDDSRNSGSNCGPCCASMILKANGINIPSKEPSNYLRDKYMGGGNDARGIGQVINAINNGSNGTLKAQNNSYDKTEAGYQKFLSDARAKLAEGKDLIVCFKNPAYDGKHGGHYLVVQGVNPDGSMIFADPQMHNNGTTYSPERIKEAFLAGAAEGSNLIEIAKK